MTQKELDEIIDDHLFENDCHLLRHEKDTVKKIARSLYNKGVTDSAENFRLKGYDEYERFEDIESYSVTKNNGARTIVLIEPDKQSVLKLLIP